MANVAQLETNEPALSDAAPQRILRLLFIHHSCGGQLLANPGREDGSDCIFRSHPNGGGLRAKLQQNSYEVHEASYGSVIGQHTDIFDWLPKFRDGMDRVLACDFQDRKYPDNCRNQIVVFKSCFPNNLFQAEGSRPGNPAGPELTVWNAKAAYAALLEQFNQWPNVLFVCVTAPPLAPRIRSAPSWRRLAKRWLRRQVPVPECDPIVSAWLARQFNGWLAAPEGWLANSRAANVIVFDYYDLLTRHGKSNFSVFPTDGGFDSHPAREGNQRAADALVSLLNRAVRRAGLSWREQPFNR